MICLSRSLWLRAQRRGSAAARLLGLRVRIPPGAMVVLFLVGVCFQVEVSGTDRSLVQRSPTECGVSVCNSEASIMRRPWPTRNCWTIGDGGGDLAHLDFAKDNEREFSCNAKLCINFRC